MFAPVITIVFPERSMSGTVVLPNVWQERKVRTSPNVGIAICMIGNVMRVKTIDQSGLKGSGSSSEI